MAFEQLKDTLYEVDTDIRSYLKNTEAHLQLRVFKILMKLITSLLQAALVGSVLLLALLIMSLAISYAVGEVLGNILYGFAMVSIFFMLFALLIYIFRKQINKPIIRFFSTIYFEEL